MGQGRPKGLPKYGGRKKGTPNKRCIFMPHEGQLMTLSVEVLTKLRTRVGKILKYKKTRPASYTQLQSVFNEVLAILESKRLEFNLFDEKANKVIVPRGTMISREMLLKIPFRLFQAIGVLDLQVEQAVVRSLAVLLDNQGQLPDYRPWGELAPFVEENKGSGRRTTNG